MSYIKSLKVDVKTSNRGSAGTDADIYLLLSWRTPGRAEGSTVQLPDQPGGDNEQGRMTSYKFSIPRLCQLQDVGSLALVNGMNGSGPGWHVESVSIEAIDEDLGNAWKLVDATLNRWLDTKEPTGPAVVLPLKVPFKDLGRPNWSPTVVVS